MTILSVKLTCNSSNVLKKQLNLTAVLNSSEFQARRKLRYVMFDFKIFKAA